MQSVDYRYNIRGQLTSINNSRLGTTDSKNDDTNDIFGMELMYDQPDANITGSTADYTGRISAVKWMSKNTSGTAGNERSYYYTYDEVNRLKGAVYGERTAAGVPFSTNAGGFDEKAITYDENGNILGLQRNQLAGSTVSSIDALTYSYDSTYPNRLLAVTDAAPTATKAQGFNQNGSGGSYAYYASGNLQTDPYKGISLTYNDLNRTDVVTVTAARSISYVYDASGTMIHKKQTDTGTGTTTTTDYVDGFVYINGNLSYLAMPEGRVLYNGGALKPEYVINDNQGNARVSFTDNGTGAGVTITQETSFYSFGLAMSSNTTTSGANKNLYNGGSEWQNDFGNMPDFYQTFYRNYDAAIGRWMAMDPEPESAESMSPYHYSGNNPVMFNDPMGNMKIAPQDDPYKPPVFGPSHDIDDTFNEIDNYNAGQAAFAMEMGGLNAVDPGYVSYLASSGQLGDPIYNSNNPTGAGGMMSYDALATTFNDPQHFAVGLDGGVRYEYNEAVVKGGSGDEIAGFGVVGRVGYLGGGDGDQGGGMILSNAHISGFFSTNVVGGSLQGNVSGLGFTVLVTTHSNDGESSSRTIPVLINEASFMVPKFTSKNKNIAKMDKVSASLIFTIAYNSAIDELDEMLHAGLEPKLQTIDEFELRKDFIGLVDANMLIKGAEFRGYYVKGAASNSVAP